MLLQIHGAIKETVLTPYVPVQTLLVSNLVTYLELYGFSVI